MEISARARPPSSAAWPAASARIADEVSSPTFTLIQEYAGRGCILHHVDLYRLEPAEIEDLGLDDLIAARGVVAIEWAERWNGRPADAVEVWFEHVGEDRRRIRHHPSHYPTITRHVAPTDAGLPTARPDPADRRYNPAPRVGLTLQPYAAKQR
jgi:hypothetical protein